MTHTLMVALLLMSAFALAKRGPMPHERTDIPGLPNATVGRYLYLGDVPKFEATELEFTISKLNLTNRVTAHVTQARIDGYANQLFLRWKSVRDALSDHSVSLAPLVKLSKLAEGKPVNVQAWARIAEQYSTHMLEKSGLPIYKDKRGSQSFSSNQEADDYKETISEAYFRTLFSISESSDVVINDNAKLSNLLSAQNSRNLFNKHLGHLFTRGSDRPGYVGTLNFVYPVAASVEGPFDQPREQVTTMKTAESVEARWWSNKWKDEFGGFPFLLIEWSGVAFHGPITSYSPIDVWYLRRGYVSHGCHRMDASDVLEMRALMPADLRKATDKIKVTILENFDVTDWNKDGIPEAIDVKYYHVPSSIAVPKTKKVEEAISAYLVENQAKIFIRSNPFAAKFYDVASDKLVNIPRYVFNKNTISKAGTHDKVDIFRFDFRPTRVIQYSEAGVKLQGFDDVGGKYPPKFFQRY